MQGTGTRCLTFFIFEQPVNERAATGADNAARIHVREEMLAEVQPGVRGGQPDKKKQKACFFPVPDQRDVTAHGKGCGSMPGREAQAAVHTDPAHGMQYGSIREIGDGPGIVEIMFGALHDERYQ